MTTILLGAPPRNTNMVDLSTPLRSANGRATEAQAGRRQGYGLQGIPFAKASSYAKASEDKT